MFRLLIAPCLTILFGTYLYASDNKAIKSAIEVPLTIDSRDGLKCDRAKGVCTAQGHVVVRKGPYEMFAEKGQAFMRKNEAGKSEIRRIEAYTNVRFFGLGGEAATSDEAYFDMDEKLIRLIPHKNKQVHVWKDDYVLLADDLTIHLEPDQDNKLRLHHIEAHGHITLSSLQELVKGDDATYTPATSLVDITGDVRVNRHEGQLRGSYAQVNIDTKLSKVLKRADVDTDKKVQVFVYPEKAKENQLVKGSQEKKS